MVMFLFRLRSKLFEDHVTPPVFVGTHHMPRMEPGQDP